MKPNNSSSLPRSNDAENRARRDVEVARKVMREEAESLRAASERLGEAFARSVETIASSRGRLIVTGVGKSGLVAKNIAATLTSTGTPSLYIHPVEAAHGDLGLVGADDVALIISKSGMSDELRQFVPSLKKLGVRVVGITGDPRSYLARHSDVVLDSRVPVEAGPLGLAPTSSSTVALVLGHAIAGALIERNGFTAEDFARVHPSGILGKRLNLTVEELMRKGAEVPLVQTGTTLQEALIEIMEKSIGCTGVVDADQKLVGIITDGDLKRILAGRPDALSVPVEEVMTREPKTCDAGMLAADALAAMELNRPGPLLMYFIVDEGSRPRGLLHMHDVLRAGFSVE